MLFEKQEISLAKLGPTEIAAELEHFLRLVGRWSQLAEIQSGTLGLWELSVLADYPPIPLRDWPDPIAKSQAQPSRLVQRN